MKKNTKRGAVKIMPPPQIKKAPGLRLTAGFVMQDGKFKRYQKVMDAVKQNKADQTQEIQPQNRGAFQGLITPPLDPDNLSLMLQLSTPHFRSVKAKAGDSVKRGWSLEAVEGVQQSEQNKRTLLDFFSRPSSSGQTLGDTLEAYVMDYEAIGYAGLELVEDSTGLPIQLNHIPAKTLKRHKDFSRIQHSRDNKETWFKRAGTDIEVNAKTGELGDFEFSQRGNKLLWINKYHPSSDYYGMPDITPALKAVTGDLFQKEFNLDFFENGAIPAYMVIIEGAELDETLEQLLEDFFTNELKGVGNTQRTMILPIPIEGVKVTIEKITPVVNEGSFRLYHEQNQDEILQADGVPPTRAFLHKSGSFGRDQSRELNKNYKEAEIEPLQNTIEAQINIHIILAGFGFKDWVFKLKPLFFEDRELLAQAAERLKKTESLSTNEIRRILSPIVSGGLEPVEGGEDVRVLVGGIPTPISSLDSSEKRQKSYVCDGWKVLFDPVAIESEDELSEWDGAGNEKVLEVVRVLRPIVDKFEPEFRAIFRRSRQAMLANLRKSAGGRVRILFKQELPVNIIAVLRDFDDTEIAIEELNFRVGAEAYESGFNLAERRVGVALDFSLQRSTVQKYLNDTVGPFSKNISNGISNRIRRTLARGITEGESIPDLAKRIEKVFDSVDRSKAVQIARTETARAHNIGTVDGYEQSSIVRAIEVDDGSDFDIPCAQADGAEWTLTRARENPIEHPNCVRSFSPITVKPGESRP